MRYVFYSLAGLFFIGLTQTGCLKTRAQLREEESTMAPVGVREVDTESSDLVAELKTEIIRLNGRISELESQMTESGKQNVENLVEQLEKRIIELEQSQMVMLSAIKKVEHKIPPPNAKNVFITAKNQYRAKKYPDAIKNFTLYLKSGDQNHIQETTFLRAESYYAEKEYQKAIIDYSKFPEKYQKSKKLPKVLYKIGLSFEGLGKKSDAKLFYDELVRKFPKSAEAKKAKSKLKTKKL
tara:strand:- start:151 stop:867 length:717 start_codon:yes stop_codon:yes gene_type:complete